MEEEVVSHLMSYNFTKIAKNTLIISDEPRLTVRFIYQNF